MEKSEYSFGAYRYFIVPNDQISLFDAIEEKRKKAVQNFFSALVVNSGPTATYARTFSHGITDF